jgi:hypothetical protein
VGETFARCRGIVKTEAQDVGSPAGDVGQQGVVCVDDRGGGRVELGERGAPALGHELELAVAVELVAEEVPEQDRVRAHAA